MTNESRYAVSDISQFGITHLSKHPPYVVAWWSAAFPGFGHLLLNQYLRGILLTLSEIAINSCARVNEAMVYSFCGKFGQAAAVLRPDWYFGYIAVYLFALWDSYRSALVHNKLADLAEMKRPAVRRLLVGPIEIQYIDRKKPGVGLFYSLLFPGLGELYNQRFCLSFYFMFWWWTFAGLSHFYRSLLALTMGRVAEAADMLSAQWLLFMPSVCGGSMYHAYVNAKHQNELFRLEQRNFLAERYGDSQLEFFP